MLKFFGIFLFAMSWVWVSAGELPLTKLPVGPLGTQAGVMVEEGAPLSLAEARSRQRAGAFHLGTQPVPSFGIGSRPVWLHLSLVNPTDHSLPFRLSAGTTWIDHLDVYLVQGDQVVANWRTGDALPNAQGITPGMGFTFNLNFPAGKSELFLRADTMDPLVLPLGLQSVEQALESEHWSYYGYGFLYGALLMLIVFNVLIYLGVHERGHLYYSHYLLSFLLLSLAYSGHGMAWIWPAHPIFQRYVILILMMLYGCCALIFASRFLALSAHAPRTLRGVRIFMLSGAILISVFVAMDSQQGAAIVAFSFVALFLVGMILLGILTVRAQRKSGAIFLAAALFGIVGALTTTLAVWGWIPFNRLTYHSLEFGILIEGTILALALAWSVKGQKQSYLRAKDLAWHDPLTGLPNRRALMDRLEQTLALAMRQEFSFALMFVDLDHFKPINDKHGHEAGDWLLREAAKRMRACVRASDTVARVGGDEFVVLLSSIEDSEQSLLVAEKIRSALEELFNYRPAKQLRVTSSIGVSLFPDHGASQRDLMKACDDAMYLAKSGGRNSVVLAELSLADRLSEAAKIPSSLGLIIFHWRRAYQTGNAIIDAEHHELFNFVNNMLKAGLTIDTQPQKFAESTDELIRHVGQHFAHEEVLLAEYGYADLQEHVELHRELMTRAEELHRKNQIGEAHLGDWLQFLANDLVIGHILREDRLYTTLFKGD